jgi:ferritin-like metal-binding protein YciE
MHFVQRSEGGIETMPDLNERDTKLVQYLNEAYGKEKELEAALEAHINMTERAPYKKRLRAHLRETKGHSRKVEQRIKRLGGSPQAVQTVVGKATATLKGPVHALRGSGAEERQLKNAKTEYSEEAEEIATYNAIEAFADSVGDRDTAKVAREIRREEERMARFLERLIPRLTKAVARAEVPANQRSDSRRRRTRRRSGPSRRRGSTARGRASTASSRRSAARRSSSTGRGRGRGGGRS